MFISARIKLTAWYLLIIMAVSLSLSAVIYRIQLTEIQRVEFAFGPGGTKTRRLIEEWDQWLL